MSISGAFASFIKRKQQTQGAGGQDDASWAAMFHLQSVPTSARLIKKPDHVTYHGHHYHVSPPQHPASAAGHDGSGREAAEGSMQVSKKPRPPPATSRVSGTGGASNSQKGTPNTTGAWLSEPDAVRTHYPELGRIIRLREGGSHRRRERRDARSKSPASSSETEEEPYNSVAHTKSTIPFLLGGMFQLGYYKDGSKAKRTIQNKNESLADAADARNRMAPVSPSHAASKHSPRSPHLRMHGKVPHPPVPVSLTDVVPQGRRDSVTAIPFRTDEDISLGDDTGGDSSSRVATSLGGGVALLPVLPPLPPTESGVYGQSSSNFASTESTASFPSLPMRDDVDSRHDIPLLDILAKAKQMPSLGDEDDGRATGAATTAATFDTETRTGTAHGSRAASNVSGRGRKSAVASPRGARTNQHKASSASPASPSLHKATIPSRGDEEPESIASDGVPGTTQATEPTLQQRVAAAAAITASAALQQQRLALYKELDAFDRAVVLPSILAQEAADAAASGGANDGSEGPVSINVNIGSGSASVNSTLGPTGRRGAGARGNRGGGSRVGKGAEGPSVVPGATVPVGRNQRGTAAARSGVTVAAGGGDALGASRRISPEYPSGAAGSTMSSAVDLSVPMLPALGRNPICGLLCGVSFTAIVTAAENLFARRPATRSLGLTLDDFRQLLDGLVPGAATISTPYLKKMFDPFVPPGTNAVPLRTPFSSIFSYLCRFNGRSDVERNLRIFFAFLDEARKGVIPLAALRESVIVAWAQNRVIGRALSHWIQVGKAFGEGKIVGSGGPPPSESNGHGSKKKQQDNSPAPSSQASSAPGSLLLSQTTALQNFTCVSLDDLRILVYGTEGIAEAMGSHPLDCVLTDAPRYPLKIPPPPTQLLVLSQQPVAATK